MTAPRETLEGPPAPRLAHRTLCEAFQATVAAHGDRVALRTPDDSVRITWSEYGERVRRIAGALAALGVDRGDTVGLLLGSRPEATLVDAAAIHLGAACVSLYLAGTPAAHAYVLTDTDARVLVTETALASGAPALRRACPRLEHVLCVDGEAGDGPRRRGRPAPRIRLRRPLARRPPGRSRGPAVHVRHHRRAQGRGAHPRDLTRDRQRLCGRMPRT